MSKCDFNKVAFYKNISGGLLLLTLEQPLFPSYQLICRVYQLTGFYMKKC